MSLLGIDIGSGSIKAVAFAADGDIIAQAAEPYRTRHGAGGREAQATLPDHFSLRGAGKTRFGKAIVASNPSSSKVGPGAQGLPGLGFTTKKKTECLTFFRGSAFRVETD